MEPKTEKERGQKGGESTLKRYGREFYSMIGKKGGRALREQRGSEYFSRIGRMKSKNV